MKHAITWLVFALLAAAAVYSWNALHFGERTAVFFTRPDGTDRDGAFPMRGRLETGLREGGREWGEWRGSSLRRDGDRMQRRHAGRGRHGRGGEGVALENVLLYSAILTFTAMATWQLERLIRQVRRA